MNQSLPRHQYSSFGDLTKRFSATYISPGYRWAFLLSIAIWRRIFRIDPVEKVIAKDFESDHDGFWHATWIWSELFYPEISATFIGEASPADPYLRAAQLIHAASSFYLKAKTQSLPPEVSSGRPQDMERYRYLFSRLTIASRKGSKIKHRISDMPDSNYVIVGVGNQLLKVTAIKDGMPVPVTQLLHAITAELSAVTDHEWEEPYAPPLAQLTALQNKATIDLWKKLEEKNQEAVTILNQALFTISIDTDLKPTNIDQRLSNVNSKMTRLRDCRRSLQIIVLGDGSFGAVVNPHAGIGGTLSARFVSELSAQCAMPVEPSMDHMEPFLAERLTFIDPSLNLSTLQAVRDTIESRLYSEDDPTTFVFQNIGEETFKAKNFHIDAAFHAALTLAWFRHRGYIPTVGNFINLRSTKFGDIWRYNASTDAMREFVYQPTLETFKLAQQEHIALIKKHKSANDEFYLGAMALKRLVCEGMVRFSGFVSLVTILSIFVRDFGRRFLNPDLWVSCIPSLPGVQGAGRGGATMSYLAKTSTGGHYMIFDNHIMVCLMNAKNGKWRGSERAFAEELQRCLHIVAEL